MIQLRTDTIARQFLWRVLPLSMFLMAAIWALAALFVERTIRAEGQLFVGRSAHDIAAVIQGQMQHLIEAARIVSQSELLVAGLLDEGSRAFTLPAYMRSLRLPDVRQAGFALLDHAGAVVALSGVTIPAPHLDMTEPDPRAAPVLSAEGLRAVFPVRYGAWTEGYLVLWVSIDEISDLLAATAREQLGELTIRIGDSVLFESCCDTRGGKFRSRPVAVADYPGLEIEFRVDPRNLFPAAFRLNWFLLGAFGADVLVLLGASLAAGAAVARPLERIIRDIRSATERSTLVLRGYDRAPREVRFLVATLNTAAARLATEVERRREALRQAEAHAARNDLLAAAIDRSGSGITISDARAVGQPLVYANPAFFRMTGSEPSEVIGRSCHLLHERGADPETRARLRQAMTDGREIQVEIGSHRKDSSESCYLLSLYPVHDAGHALSHTIGVLIDVTEQRRMRAVAAQTAHLTSLGEMATGLAHELNQPLNVIRLSALNLASQLAAVAGLPATVGNKLDRIQRNVDRAAGIIEHMKVFGRGDSGPPASFRLRDAVNGALKIVAEELRSAGIDVMRNFDPGDPCAWGKLLAVEQVAINLALNARDAILARRAAGGAEGAADRIEFGLTTQDDMALLWVEDTGGGIPEAIRARIFEPFFTTKPPGKGTGLGLSVSFGIAAELGGTLTAVNTARGAKFVLSLPLANTDDLVRAVP